MYDELIKRLRDSEHEIDCSLCDRDCCYPDGKVHGKCIIIEAADAIEVLSKKENTTHWIPVTEEPPLKVGDDGYNGYLVYANGYYEVADYTTDKFDNVPYFHVNGEYEPDVTHWMPLPEPPKEET